MIICRYGHGDMRYTKHITLRFHCISYLIWLYNFTHKRKVQLVMSPPGTGVIITRRKEKKKHENLRY